MRRHARKRFAAVNLAVVSLLGAGRSWGQAVYMQMDYGQLNTNDPITGYYNNDTYWSQVQGTGYNGSTPFTSELSNWSPSAYQFEYPNDMSVGVTIDSRYFAAGTNYMTLDVSVDAGSITVGSATSNTNFITNFGSTLSLFGSTQINGGTITIDGTTSINFVNNELLSALGTTAGFGTVIFSGNVTNTDAEVIVNSGATLTVSSAETLTTVGENTYGEIILSGNLLNEGDINSNFGGIGVITSGSPGSSTLTNVGTMTAGGDYRGNLSFSATGAETCTVVNTNSYSPSQSGLIEATSGGTVTFSASSVVENSSLIEAYGTATNIIVLSPTINNNLNGTSGQIVANMGTLTFWPENYAACSVTGGTLSAVNAGDVVLQYGSSFNSLSLTIDSTSQLLVPAYYGGGTISDCDVTDNGQIAVDGGNTLNFAGNSLLTGTGTLTLGGSLTVNTSGTLTQDLHHTITGTGGCSINIDGTLVNNGTIIATGVNGTFDFDSTGFLANTNTIAATSGGKLEFDYVLSVNNYGTIQAIGSASTVTFYGLSTSNGTSGQIIANAGTVVFSVYNSAGFDVSTLTGGTLSAVNGGCLETEYGDYYGDGPNVDSVDMTIDSTSVFDSTVRGTLSNSIISNNGTFTCSSVNGPLSVVGCNITQGTSGLIATSGSSEIDFYNTNITGGLLSTNAGSITVNGASRLAMLQAVVGDGTHAASLILSPSIHPTTFGSLTINSNSYVDISNNKLVINYGSPSNESTAVSAVVAALTVGYNGGQWTGMSTAAGAIVSSSAAALYGASHPTSIGYADTNTDATSVLSAPNQVVIIYTLAGDANLDGSVDFNDQFIVGQHLNTTGNDWSKGNFNYSPNGYVDFNDLAIMGQNLNSSIAPLESSVSMPTTVIPLAATVSNGTHTSDTSVPEPSTFGIMLMACGAIFRRRRKPRSPHGALATPGLSPGP